MLSVFIKSLYLLSFLIISIISFSRGSFTQLSIENMPLKNVLVVEAVFTLLIGLYLFLTLWNKVNFTQKSIKVLAVAIIFLLVITPPLLSVDIYAYMVSAKSLATTNINIYANSLLALTSNPWMKEINAWWNTLPAAYGPLFYFMITPLGLVNNILTAVYLYKIINVIFYIFAIFLLKKLIDLLSLDSKILYLFLFNPSLLIHVFLDGHNDIIIVSLLFFSIYYLTKKKNEYAIILTSLSIVVKYMTIIFLPVFVFTNSKRVVSNGIKTIIITAVVIIISLIPLFMRWENPKITDPINSLLIFYINPQAGCLYRCSPFIALTNGLFLNSASFVRLIIFTAAYLYLIYFFLYKEKEPIKFMFWSFVGFLFLYTPWITPWYALVPTTLSFLLFKEEKYIYLNILLTSYSLWHYFFI